MSRTAVAQHIASVDSLSLDGRGIARVDGKAVFIDGALPGERVSYRIEVAKRRFDTARLVEVIESSPERVAPGCTAFGRCGGCTLQHLAPGAQLAAKERALLDSLQRIGGVSPGHVLPAIAGPAWNYRRRARLGARVVSRKGGVLVGFRERARSYVTDAPQCPVLAPPMVDMPGRLRTLIDAMSRPDRVPQVELAVGENAAAIVVRHLLPLTDADQTLLRRFGEQNSVQVYVQPAGPDSVAPVWPPAPERLWYELPARPPVRIHFEPTDFVQVNAEINRQAVSRVLEYLQPRPGERILDLFCGVGNFSLPLARSGASITGLEGEAVLVERARENAVANGIANAEFACADLAAESPAAGWFNRVWDGVMLDPPRSGAAALIPMLRRCGAKRIVYVSCDPATLARDAQMLVDGGKYRLHAAGVMDMFPHTGHVESMAVFDRTAA